MESYFFNRCGRVYKEQGKDHVCILLKEHWGACSGHYSSQDLVPANHEAAVVRYRENLIQVAVWPCSDLSNVWLAYAPPPFDVMAQGAPNGGSASALKRLANTLSSYDRWEQHDKQV